MTFFNQQSGRVGIIFLLVIVLLSLLVGGLYMLDRMDLVDGERVIYSTAMRIPVVRDYLVPTPLTELELQENRLRELENMLARREAQLDSQRRSLEGRESELDRRFADVERLEDRIEERERALLERQRRFDEVEERFVYLASLYEGMPPAEAAARINDIDDDQIVIALLQRMERRTVSFILTNLEPERVARITRKIANSPG